jgi:hypothetical protein
MSMLPALDYSQQHYPRGERSLSSNIRRVMHGISPAKVVSYIDS